MTLHLSPSDPSGSIRRHPERTEQRAIVDLLRKLGASVWVLGTTRRRGDHPGTMQSAGLPDVFAVLPAPRVRDGSPTAVWIEVKAPHGRPSEAQKAFRVDCQRAHLAHVLGGVDAVVTFLAAGGWIKELP